jgi:hypothetical protein
MILKETTDTENLAIFVAHQKGYKLTMEREAGSEDISWYVAEKDEDTFSAHSFVELLGLIELGETRKQDWRLNQEEAAYTSSIEDEL